MDVWKDVKKVGGVELAWGKYQSGCKYQSESESESESESIKVDVWKDVEKVRGVEFAWGKYQFQNGLFFCCCAVVTLMLFITSRAFSYERILSVWG